MASDPAPAHPDMPRNVVVVLLDSLNRHLLEAYGSDEFSTPNLTRLARRSVRFTNHHTGSLPCMPARHDVLCGALDFLWRPWGSVEIWEDAITYDLRRKGVVTQLVTDHPHLFESGGENYHTDFSAWDYVRGHEDDPWKTRLDPSWLGAPALAAQPASIERGYDRSRTYFRSEEDFPGPQTMSAAARWLRENAHHHDRFFLFVDEFDPHEPFDTPEPWASMYDPGWRGPRVIWPPYTDATGPSVPSERTGRHIRANYGAKLSMIDHHLGKVLDALDDEQLWANTAVVLMTDHGHYLGERGGIWGKPGVPVYNEMGHIPLMIAWPGSDAFEVHSLSTTVDVHATLCEIFDVTPVQRTHGRSLVSTLRAETSGARSHLLTGVWGREVTYVDDDVRLVRAPNATNRPLAMYSNRWSSMPVHALAHVRLPRPDRRATIDFMPGSPVPVLRQPYGVGDEVPYWASARSFHGDVLFDRREDPAEVRDLASGRVERGSVHLEALVEALRALEAPLVQFERLGLD
ncbi:MAG: sulfatase [Acidimicrobiaceae bacterium]|nr:sulfatase [Acidimicrobiaceae bacterium]